MADSTAHPHRPTRWEPNAAPSPEARAARIKLATAIRRLNDVLIDTNLSDAALLEAAATLDVVADRLAEGPEAAPHWGYAESAATGSARAMLDRSPVVGKANAIAPPLSMEIREGVAYGWGQFGTAYEGPPGHVHGGWVSAAFDEVLGLVQSMSGLRGMTGTLVVRYRKPTPLHTDLTFRCRLDRVEGRKIFTSGVLEAGGVLCAEAEAVFISVGAARFASLADEAAQRDARP